MPAVEATACGAPMALRRIPVFDEIAGRDACCVDPMDVEGWHQTLKDPIDEGEHLPCRGLQADLTQFSRSSSAATTLNLYHRRAKQMISFKLLLP